MLRSSSHAVLRGLGFQFARGAYVEKERHVDEQRVIQAYLAAQLPQRLQEWQSLDVAHRAADLNYYDIRMAGAPHRFEPALDFVGNVRNYLDRPSKELAAPLALYYRLVYLALVRLLPFAKSSSTKRS